MVFLFLLFFTAASARAGGETGPGALTESYSWYDGEKQRTVWIEPGVVVEFSQRNEGGKFKNEESAVERADPGASPLARQLGGGARLWRLSQGASAKNVAARALAPATPPEDAAPAIPQGRVSPVFHQGPSKGAPLLGLPGGVLVQFKAAWKEEEIRRWAGERGLSVGRKLAGLPNLYLLETEPGLPALEKANEIHTSGEVLSATPDWWQEFSLR